MRFGQVQELLDARAQADAEPLAAPERDQRMRKLVALAERIGPRVEERREPLQPVRRGDEDRRRARSAAAGAIRGRAASRDRPRNRMPNAIATMTTNAPKSGSSRSSAAVATITANSGRKPRSSVCFNGCSRVQERRLAHRIARRVQHDRELHELGRLQIDDDERQPATAAVDRAADAGNQHQHEQDAPRPRTPRARAAATPSSGSGTRRARQPARRRGRARGARGNTTRESRCTTTPRPSRSTPNRPSRDRPRAAAASPTRATRRRSSIVRGLRGSAPSAALDLRSARTGAASPST